MGRSRADVWTNRCWRLAPAILYLLLGAPFSWNDRHHFTSDSAVYMDMARLMAEGRFPEAFVGYWGPLFPALTGVLLRTGLPVVAAAKVVGFLSGLAWVLALQWFLSTRLPGRVAAAGAIVGGIPAALVVGVPFSILPDACLSVAVMLLCAALSSDGRRPGGKGPLLAGAACGLAYLCKTPAWVLFAPPAVASLAWSRWRAREATPRLLRGATVAAALFAAGFVLVAGALGHGVEAGAEKLGHGVGDEHGVAGIEEAGCQALGEAGALVHLAKQQGTGVAGEALGAAFEGSDRALVAIRHFYREFRGSHRVGPPVGIA